jgi:hypothetical protein
MDKTFIDQRRWFDVQWPLLEARYSPYRILTRLFPVEVRTLRTCPCCGYPTLQSRNCYEICHLCWWEDDGQDDADLDEVGGPNDPYSLVKARKNFKTSGIMFDHSDERYQPIGSAIHSFRGTIITAFEKLRTTSDEKERRQLFRFIKKALRSSAAQQVIPADVAHARRR